MIDEILPKDMISKFQRMGMDKRLQVATWLMTNNLDYNTIDHPDDCTRMSGVLWEHDVIMSDRACQKLWRDYSDKFYLVWSMMPEDDDKLLDILLKEIDNARNYT